MKNRASGPPAKILVTIFPEPKDCAKVLKTQLEAFHQIFTPEMIKEIVLYTNFYIEMKRNSTNYSRDSKDTTK